VKQVILNYIPQRIPHSRLQGGVSCGRYINFLGLSRSCIYCFNSSRGGGTLKRLQEIQLSENQTVGNASVLSPTLPPTSPLAVLAVI